jgi:exonuclease III
MIIEVTQFMNPSGRQVNQTTKIKDQFQEKYVLMKRLGCRFTAEVLNTGQVSVCIEEPDYGDIDIRIIPNGPKVQSAYEEMLADFTQEKYDTFIKEMS